MVAPTQKGPLSWQLHLPFSPLLMVSSGGGHAGPALQPFPELADRAGCTGPAHIPGSLAGEALAPGPISTNTDRPPQSSSRRGAGTTGLGGGNIDHCGQGSRCGLFRHASPSSGGPTRGCRSGGSSELQGEGKRGWASFLLG